jgi:hypothetical protein
MGWGPLSADRADACTRQARSLGAKGRQDRRRQNVRKGDVQMQTDSQRLADADACHDAEPPRAAELLRQIDAAALTEGERPLYAFLLNHVLGEKLGDWGDAHAYLEPLLAQAGEAAPPVLWRQAAVAATLAGDGAAAAASTDGLARTAAVAEVQAQELVRLVAATFAVPGAAAVQAGPMALAAVALLDAPHWHTASALDTPAAASCNNLAAALSERPLEDLREPALREALLRAARGSQRLWQRAGNWVNHERACYGVAVAAGALGDATQQRDCAVQGLALLDAHDSARQESVDRAFLELELAHAWQRLGHTEHATAARTRADALAATFDEAALTQWYQERLQRHQQLLAG